MSNGWNMLLALMVVNILAACFTIFWLYYSPVVELLTGVMIEYGGEGSRIGVLIRNLWIGVVFIVIIGDIAYLYVYALKRERISEYV